MLLRVIAGVDGIDDRQSVGTPYPSQVPNYHTLLLAARKAQSLLMLPDSSFPRLGLSFPVGDNTSRGIGTNEYMAADVQINEGARGSPIEGMRKMRIGILKEGGEITGMDKRVFECVKNAAMKFKDLNAEVEGISIPDHLAAAQISRVLRCVFFQYLRADLITTSRFSTVNDLLGRAAGRKQLYLTDFTALLHPWTQEKFDKVLLLFFG